MAYSTLHLFPSHSCSTMLCCNPASYYTTSKTSFCSRVGWACEGLDIHLSTIWWGRLSQYQISCCCGQSICSDMLSFVNREIVNAYDLTIIAWVSLTKFTDLSTTFVSQNPIHIWKIFWAILPWLTSPLQVKFYNWRSCFLSKSCLRKTSYVHCLINWKC